MGLEAKTRNRRIYAYCAQQARRILGPMHGSLRPRPCRTENETRCSTVAKGLILRGGRLFSPSRGDPHRDGTTILRIEFAGRGTMSMLHRASQFVAIALAIVILGLPLSACLTSAAKVSAEQRECCQKMAGLCETSVMPSSHSCCQHTVSRQAIAVSKVQRNDAGSAVATLAEALPPVPHLIVR